MEKFIVAGGCAIRVSDTLKGGRNVVLLHGYLESLDIWDGFTKLIRPYARVVAPDLPGHGISEVRGPVHTMEFLAGVVHGALKQLGIAKCTMVGHSMGGYAALAFAARYPEMLEGLVLFSSTPNPDPDEKREARAREITAVQGGKKELLARTLPAKGFAPENRTKFADVIEDLDELVMVTEDEGITALLRGMMERPDRNDMLRGLDIPQMFVFGRHDEYMPVAAAETIAEHHPQARVVWLEHSGHMGFIEEPEASAAALLEFMETEKIKLEKR